MTLESFKQRPWRTTHPKYKESPLSISPSPEYASSEVLMASLYRTIGYEDLSEGGVPQSGRHLDKEIQRLREKGAASPEGATIGPDILNSVLHGILESPKLPNQSSKRFLQVTPLVPGAALFSGTARLSSNSWPAGSLVRRMVSLGSKSRQEGQKLWSELFEALSVSAEDDVFAIWLQQEFQVWARTSEWQLVPIPDDEAVSLAQRDYVTSSFLPARQFVKDLRSVISAKGLMTRRQWTSLLESVLRLAAAAHIMWLCDVQARIWRCLADSLTREEPMSEVEVREAIFPPNAQYMIYGGRALNGLKDKTSAYLSARLGINHLLWVFDHLEIPLDGDVASSEGIARLCKLIHQNKSALAEQRVWEEILSIREGESRALSCKKGIGSNMLEFFRHALGQRQTAVDLLRGYDQGFVLKKSGSSSASPWVVSLGPVAVLAIVHCALAGMNGPRSIHRLSEHLASYGVVTDRYDIARNDLGQQLRMLGLVLDSPDAESGMLLLPPFATFLPNK